MKIDFTEMRKLQRMLDEANIPYDIHKLFSDEQIEYFRHKDVRVCDVICHEYSYGVEQGLLEMMGLCDTARKFCVII